MIAAAAPVLTLTRVAQLAGGDLVVRAALGEGVVALAEASRGAALEEVLAGLEGEG